VATLAQLGFGCNKNGLQLLVVVDGVARKARQLRLGVGSAEIDRMATGAMLLDGLRRRSREALDFFRITTALDVRGSRPVTGLTALRLRFRHLQGVNVSGSGEGLVLVLVTALADVRTHVLRGTYLLRTPGGILGENSSTDKSSSGENERRKRQGCRANRVHETSRAAIACMSQWEHLYAERVTAITRRERCVGGGCGQVLPNVRDRRRCGDPD
jgi:hypothetical protein